MPGKPPPVPMSITCAPSSNWQIVAIAKECYDKFIKKTKIDYVDILFTILAPVIIIIFKEQF